MPKDLRCWSPLPCAPQARLIFKTDEANTHAERLCTFSLQTSIQNHNRQNNKQQKKQVVNIFTNVLILGAPPQRGINGKQHTYTTRDTHTHTHTTYTRGKKKFGTKPARRNARRVRPTSALYCSRAPPKKKSYGSLALSARPCYC